MDKCVDSTNMVQPLIAGPSTPTEPLYLHLSITDSEVVAALSEEVAPEFRARR